MRNPNVWRNIALGFAASGVLAVIAAQALPAAAARGWLGTILVMYGLNAVLFGGGSALFRHLDVRAQRRLLRGDDVLARWHVDADTWRRFIALDRELRVGPDRLGNEFSPRSEPSTGDIEIIAGKSAVSIDSSIHLLTLAQITHLALIENGAVPYIEFQLYYPDSGYGASGASTTETRTALRFPVAHGAMADAARFLAHFDGSQPRKPDFFHGRGDGSDPEDLNTCWSCGYFTHQLIGICPRCGKSMQTRRWTRRLGLILIPCGLFLTGVMGWVLLRLAPMLLHPGMRHGSARFSGSWPLAVCILVLLGLPFVFGLTTLAYGTWQVLTGKRNKKVVSLMLGVSMLMTFIAASVMKFGN